METIFQGRRIQWDDEKNLINLKKNGISLKTARMVFADEGRLEWPDLAHSDDEERYKVLGRVGKVLLVIYTQRGDATRLISARKATAQEREVYYGYSGSIGI